MSSERSHPAVRRPIPEVDELSREFWESAANGQLVIQRCTACRRFHHHRDLFALTAVKQSKRTSQSAAKLASGAGP